MVAQQPRFSLALFFDGGWRQLQLREVTDGAVRQDGPEAVVDELGHLFA
jgi:hypothetical protein